MKYGFLADIHAHEFPEFARLVRNPDSGVYINSRLMDTLDTLWYCLTKGAELGVRKWVFLGDTFHTRGQVPTITRNSMWSLLCKAHREYGCEFIILVGNHDQTDKNGQIHSIHEWQGIGVDGGLPFVTVIDTPTYVPCGKRSLWCVPYMADKAALLEALESPEAQVADVLCMHAGVDGAVAGTLEYRIKEPITVKDLKPERHEWVLLGHYHAPQQLADNVMYVGSPCQITRAEANDTKRFLVYDTKDQSMKSYKTRAKRFYSVSWPKCKKLELRPGYYDVVVPESVDVDTVRQFFAAVPGAHIKVIRPATQSAPTSRLKVNSKTLSDGALLKQYCEFMQAPEGALDLGLHLLSQTTQTFSKHLKLEFLQVRVRNFLSLKKARLTLQRPGSVVAVQGENLDAEGFVSNGSGKSSLLPESIFWCLFGETARGLPADKVVNNVTKRDCLVQVELLAGDDHVVVTRTRKHSEYGTTLMLRINGDDATQGTRMATETKLAQVLGLDYTTFSAVVAFSPDTLRFVTSTDSEQKAVLDSILQAHRFPEALGITKSNLKPLKEEACSLMSNSRETSTRITAAEENLETARQDLANEKERERAWETTQHGKIQRLKERIQEQERQAIQFKRELEGLEEPESEVESTLEEVQEAVQQTTRMEATLLAEKKLLNQQLNEVAAALSGVMDQEGKPCALCGQVVNNTGKLKAKLASKRSAICAQLDVLEEKLRAVVEVNVNAKATLKRAQAYQSAKAVYESARDGFIRKLDTCRQVIDDHNRELLELESLTYDSRTLERLRQRRRALKETLSQLTTNKENLEALLDHLESKAKLLEFWVTGFGNKGLKSFLLERVLPQLTEYTQEFADALTGGTIKVQFSMVSHTGSEKFSVRAFNDEGSDVYAGNSSGEKRRIDIAIMLGLFKLANSRVKLNLLLMDEVFDTLDSAGIDMVAGILNDMAQERDMTIFVTSHTDLASRFFESVTVQKRGGLAYLKA